MATFDEAYLKSKGYNDPNVIRNILNNPSGYSIYQDYQRESGGGTTSTTGDPTTNAIQQSYTTAMDKYKKDLSNYNTNNPFSFDEYLKGEATRQATEQQGINTPGTYYHESLSDYLLGVGRKIERSATDTRDLLGELSARSESFGKDTQLKLTKAVNDAQQGFANAGLFDSGARYGSEGLLNTAAQSDISNEQRQTAYDVNQANKGNQRTVADYGLGQFNQNNPSAYIPGLLARGNIRGAYRESTNAVSNLAAQLTGEKEQQRNRERVALVPPELQANQGYDMLKQLGVYS